LTVEQILARLAEMSSRENVEGMARYGIRPARALGVPSARLKMLAREIGKSHELAAALWDTGIHEARLLAGLVDLPAQVTAEQMEAWAAEFDNWALCDSVCGWLFDKAPAAREKIGAWTARPEEFVKRAGFALIAWTAVHDKKAADEAFQPWLEMILREAGDGRNYVQKAVNWALRQIGKRNERLNSRAIETACRLLENGGAAGRRVAIDALRELTSAKVQKKFRKQK